MFLKGQTVRSLRSGREFVVAIDQREDSSRFAVEMEQRGSKFHSWFHADEYELVVADAEEAFETDAVQVDVEVGEEEDVDPEGDTWPSGPFDFKGRAMTALEIGNEIHASVEALLTGRPALPPPAPAALAAVKAAKASGWRMHYDNSSARRKDQPVVEGFLDYFPAAVRLTSELSRLGNEKHNPGQPLHHARGKSTDHRNCIGRHVMSADEIDPETELAEAVCVVWRAAAYLQELAENKYGWPRAPRARFPGEKP